MIGPGKPRLSEVGPVQNLEKLSILLNLGLQTNCGMVAEACDFIQLQGK